MTIFLFAVAIMLLSISKAPFQTLAEAAILNAGVNARNDVFPLDGRAFGGDDVAAVEMNRVADIFPRDVAHTVTATVTVTECGSTPPGTMIPPVPGTTPVEPPPPAGTPPASITPPVESPPDPPATEIPPVESTTPGSPSVTSETPPAIPPTTTGPPASEATPPPPGTGLSSITAPPPESSGSTAVTVPPESTPVVPSSETSLPPSTETAPPAEISTPPPAPNTGGHVNYDKTAIMAGVIFAAIAVV